MENSPSEIVRGKVRAENAAEPTELETLRAENARLREALEAIANQAMDSEYASETILEIIELASAALAATRGEQ